MLGHDPHEHVDPARTGGLGKAEELVLVEHLAHGERDTTHHREVDTRPRIEIDAQLVWMVEVGAAHRPRVPVDHAQVRGPDEMGRVVGHQLARVATAGERDSRRLQPFGCSIGDALLKEGLARDPVDPPLHDGGSLLQMAHHSLLALDVVSDQVELREARLGEEELVRFGDAQLPATHLEHDVFVVGHH